MGSLDTRGRHCRAIESDEATVGQATLQPNPDEACGYAVHDRRAATDVLLVTAQPDVEQVRNRGQCATRPPRRSVVAMRRTCRSYG
jgi:hypothetical protein